MLVERTNILELAISAAQQPVFCHDFLNLTIAGVSNLFAVLKERNGQGFRV
jgi:hypothetical protein